MSNHQKVSELTIRQHTAIAIASASTVNFGAVNLCTDENLDNWAKQCWRLADALLRNEEERNER